MFDKLLQAQQKAEELKRHMNAQSFSGSAGGSIAVVTVSGNKQILSVKIDPIVLKEEDIEMLEDVILTATNQALENADKAMQTETEAMTRNMLIDMGGLFGK